MRVVYLVLLSRFAANLFDIALLKSRTLIDLMDLTDDWIIGFIEGQGSFYSARGRSRDKVYPRFSVTQKEYHLLSRIRNYFGFGGINHTDQPTGRVWQWVISNKHDLKLVIRFLDGRMRSEKKIREYTLWKHRFRSYFENPRRRIPAK
jgi:hypothetical protein